MGYYEEDDRLDSFPIRIRFQDGSEAVCKTSKELPQGIPFVVIERRVSEMRQAA